MAVPQAPPAAPTPTTNELEVHLKGGAATVMEIIQRIGMHEVCTPELTAAIQENMRLAGAVEKTLPDIPVTL